MKYVKDVVESCLPLPLTSRVLQSNQQQSTNEIFWVHNIVSGVLVLSKNVLCFYDRNPNNMPQEFTLQGELD